MKKRPILLNRLAKNRSTKGIVIALVGVSACVGVTHTAIMIGVYLAKLGKKVALVELNRGQAFEKIEKAYEGVGFDSSTTQHFNIRKCHYYKNATHVSLMDIFAEPFDYYILDIGKYDSEYFEEFLRGDIQLVVGMISEWKKEEVKLFGQVNSQYAGHDQWTYLYPLAIKQDLADVGRYIRNKGYKIPFNPDPYLIKPETQRTLHRIIL